MPPERNQSAADPFLLGAPSYINIFGRNLPEVPEAAWMVTVN
jgi:hypothetical protein